MDRDRLGTIEKLTGEAIVYWWRAECAGDNEELLKRLPKNQNVLFRSVQKDPYPDAVSELAVRTLTLDELRDIMCQVPDGHVMLQTVQHKDLYTGERDLGIG